MSILNNYTRDVFVGEFAKNRIQEEISLFGFAYSENEMIRYYSTENETDCYLIRQNKFENNLCVTPIEMITSKTSGNVSAKKQAEDDLIELLGKKYPENYFCFLSYFIASKTDNQAPNFLNEYVNSFRTETSSVQQQANYNLITLAYCAKRINEDSYEKLVKKSQFTENELAQTHKISNSKVLAGIGYFQPDQTIAYYCNAYLPNVYKQKIALEKKNYVVSPILQISCDLSAAQNHSMKDLKDNFMSILKQTINPSYMAMVRNLIMLPPAIDPLLFGKHLNEIKPQLTDHALDAINTYSKLWNIARE